MFEFRNKIRGSQHAEDDEDWPSIVFLLRESLLPSADDAIAMARSAWGAAGEVELIGTVGPHNFAIRVAPLIFALQAFGQRYDIGADLHLSALQQQCWDRHKAWISVDLPGKKAEDLRQSGRLGSAYKTLMYFVLKHWSSNCLALYFPSEGAILPNYGDLIESIRSARRDGINLDFLKAPKPKPTN